MKILVVDDESNKLKAIMRVVKEIDGIELDSVDITLQLNEAKEKLLNHRYDLMIYNNYNFRVYQAKQQPVLHFFGLYNTLLLFF